MNLLEAFRFATTKGNRLDCSLLTGIFFSAVICGLLLPLAHWPLWTNVLAGLVLMSAAIFAAWEFLRQPGKAKEREEQRKQFDRATAVVLLHQLFKHN